MKNSKSTIWSERKKILEGIKNSLFKKEHVEAIAEKRMSICNTCPLIDTKGDLCLVPGTAPCCGACGCKLSLKIRSLSSECAHPDGPQWLAVLTENEEDHLYTNINYKPE